MALFKHLLPKPAVKRRVRNKPAYVFIVPQPLRFVNKTDSKNQAYKYYKKKQLAPLLLFIYNILHDKAYYSNTLLQ